MQFLLSLGQAVFLANPLNTASYSAMTGDQFAIWIVIAVILITALLLCILTFLKKKKK